MQGNQQEGKPSILIIAPIIAAVMIGMLVLIHFYEVNKKERTQSHFISALRSDNVREAALYLEKNSFLASMKMMSTDSPAEKDAWETPLSQVRSPEMAQLLIKYGARVNAKDCHGSTPLNRIASFPRAKILQVLIHSGADVNTRDQNGWTPLHHAANSENYENVRVLVLHGADVNARTPRGLTPYQLARKKQLADIENLLRQNGARD